MILDKAKYIQVSTPVRYWESAEVNAETCEKGSIVPFVRDGLWQPLIDLDKGVVVDWPRGTFAKFHFKVVDAGSYFLLDENKKQIAAIHENYVPDGLCHGDSGYGDYIIFSVNTEGEILDYRKRLYLNDWIDSDD